jgi:hypothetical protein
VVGDLELLVDLGIAAAVQHGLLHYLPHVSLLVLDVDGGTVLETQAAVVGPHAFVGSVLVVVEASDGPGPVRGGEEEALHEADLLLQGEVDVPFLLVELIGGDEFVLVGEIAGHEGESDGKGEGEGVVAVLEGIRFLVEDEVSMVLESTPVKYHQIL